MAETAHPIEFAESEQASRGAELPMFFDRSTCVRKGLCPILKLEGEQRSLSESHALYYGRQHSTASEILG